MAKAAQKGFNNTNTGINKSSTLRIGTSLKFQYKTKETFGDIKSPFSWIV
jgi:hypothetical protein